MRITLTIPRPREETKVMVLCAHPLSAVARDFGMVCGMVGVGPLATRSPMVHRDHVGGVGSRPGEVHYVTPKIRS